MEYIRFALKFTAIALIALLVGGYCYLIYTGDIPKPDIEGLVKQVAPSMAASGSVVVVVAFGACALLTAIAPFIYAARSGDAFTVIVSIVALVVFFAMLLSSRTVIDMVLAAIVYFTSALISVVMYSTKRIVAAVEGRE